MPDPFDETLSASSDAFFQLPGAEYVTYLKASGESRRIKAVIYRESAEQLPGIAGGSRPVINALFKNDSVRGISSDEIDTGGDRIKIAPNVNEVPVAMRFVEIINHDAGCLFLKVQ